MLKNNSYVIVMEDNMLILQEIRAFFKMKKISQKEAAEKIGKKQSYVNYILTGKVKITRETARLMHDAFGFNTEYLLFGKGNLIAEEQPVSYEPTTNNIDASNEALINRLLDELVEQRKINQELQSKLQKMQGTDENR